MRTFICWTLGIVFSLPSCLFAQIAEENAIKAAFVYNFALFTEWPITSIKAEETMELCVNAYSPLAPSFAELDGRPIKKTHLRIRRLDSLTNLPSSCRIIFIDQLDRHAWPQIKKRMGSNNVLTISDDSEISDIMILLITNNDRIVFDVDMHAVGKSGLTMSSKFLKLARVLR